MVSLPRVRGGPLWPLLLLLVACATPTSGAEISVASTPQQCGVTTISINDGSPPFDITVQISANGPNGARLEQLSTSSNSVDWLADVSAGTRVTFLLGGRDSRVQSPTFTVQQSGDDSCIGGSAKPPPTSSPPTTTADPVTPPTSPSSPNSPITIAPPPPPAPSPSSSDTPEQQPTTEDTNPILIPTNSPSSPDLTTGEGVNPSVTSTSDSNSPTNTIPVPSSGQSISSASATVASVTDGAEASILPNGSPASPTTQSSSSSASTLPIGLIVGIVGAILFILLVACVVLCWRRRRRRMSRLMVTEFQVRDPEDRPATSHSLPLKDLSLLSGKAALRDQSTTSLLSSPSRRGTRLSGASFSESDTMRDSSVLDLHPHALESVLVHAPITEPPSSPLAPSAPSRNSSNEKSPSSSRSSNPLPESTATPQTLSRSHSPQHPPSRRTVPRLTTPRPSPRRDSEVPSYSEVGRRGENGTVGAVMGDEVVYELDIGVRLAGGPPGRERAMRDVLDLRGMTMTLPPPYQPY